jgi:hypothetical protein
VGPTAVLDDVENRILDPTGTQTLTPPPPPAVQPVASRYTDYALPAPSE